PGAWGAMVGGLAHARPAVRDGVRMALRETYQEALVGALAVFARDRRGPPDARAQALGLLAAGHRRPPDWKGEWWAYHPALTPPPAKTQPWEGTPTARVALRDGLDDPGARVRLAAAEGLREAGAVDAAPALRARFHDEPDPIVRRALLSAL